jgi:hypothetical protein
MNYPKEIMKDIFWSFDDKKFNTKEDFERALIAYNLNIRNQQPHLDVDKHVLETPKVTIQYFYWDEREDDTLEPDFLLSANNSSYFTLGELLYKVHNEVCEKLAQDDHHFFEGFELWEGENPNNPDTPLYFLQQGS